MKASKKNKPTSCVADVQPQTEGSYNLPSHDALGQILPGYKTELPNSTNQKKERPSKPDINRTYQVLHPHKRPVLHDFEEDPIMAEISDLQTKEVGHYRSAMSKMAADIITLRTQVVTLEAENSQLRSDLSLHQDLGQHLLDDADIAVMTKAEIADRIASLKFKLASETSKVASQGDRIQQLQNELIKKNDSEKELLRLNRVRQQQQDLQQQQSHMADIATLEATVKQQEKVIEKMEKALEGKVREKTRQSGDNSLVLKQHRGKSDCRTEEIVLALATENSRLREELDRIRRQPFPVVLQECAQTKEVLPLKERLSLLNQLEKAEIRVKSLETQMEESCKLWGRKKQEMLTELSEHRHGFVRTSTTILHSV